MINTDEIQLGDLIEFKALPGISTGTQCRIVREITPQKNFLVHVNGMEFLVHRAGVLDVCPAKLWPITEKDEG